MSTETERQVLGLVNDQKWDRVIALAEASTRSAPVEWAYGWSLYKRGRLSEATAPLLRAVALAPRNAFFHYALGVVARALNDIVAAHEHLSNALMLRESWPARAALAEVCVLQGDLAAAERLYAEGVELEPANPRRLHTYADFLEALGRAEEARATRHARAIG